MVETAKFISKPKSKRAQLSTKTIARNNIKIKSATVNIKNEMSICFGHQNWNLVLNMMIGIRYGFF
jgi:hypothetical protein